MAESLQTHFTCELCNTPDNNTEQNGPRILPCWSVVCEACLQQHRNGDDFQCPLCDETHSALEVAHFPVAFPENLSTTEATIVGYSCSNENAKCFIHGLEASLFCKDEGCQKYMCAVCMMKNHSNHDVIAPENGFVYCRDSSIVNKVELDMVNVLCDEIINMSISEGKVKLEVPPGNGNQQPEVETKEGIGNQTKPDEKASSNDTKVIYDRVRDMEKSRTGIISPIKVDHSLITEYTSIRYVSQVQLNDSFVVCGQRAGQWELVRHRLCDGATLDQVNLGGVPAHAQEVILNGHLSIAVSYRDKRRIDFHEFKDLNKTSRSHSLNTLQPGVLCRSSPSTLLSAAVDEKSAELALLIDCSSREPTCRSTTRIWTFRSTSMCYVQQHQGRALVTVDALGLHAFDLEAKQLLWTTGTTLPKWKKSIHLTSVTTNGRGILFAVDKNNLCVQMFSAIDGRYLGYLDKLDGFWYRHPLYVNWCENTSSLILVHQKEENNYISFLKLSS